MSGFLSVQDISVQFGGIHALNQVSVDIEEGACCGIFGPNGSGKSTLLGVMSRLVTIQGGSLMLDGTDFTGHRPADVARLGIARTFQTVRLLPMFSVRKNVMLGLYPEVARRGPMGHLGKITHMLRDERSLRKAADAALERVGMVEHGSERPQDLPYGYQRQIEIARALIGSPRVLLLDEPVAGMNQAERVAIQALMRDLKSAGITQLLIEHDLEMIHRTCDRAYALDFGRVMAEGPPREVAQQKAVREAYLGVESPAAMDSTS
jgi:ABC-type branched-subunit amino acid transport system ATPase component